MNVPGAVLKQVQVDVGRRRLPRHGQPVAAGSAQPRLPGAGDRLRRHRRLVAGRRHRRQHLGRRRRCAWRTAWPSGTARMTADARTPARGGITFAATINGNIDIAGLQANVQATITWDGQHHRHHRRRRHPGEPARHRGHRSRQLRRGQALASSARTSSSPSRSCPAVAVRRRARRRGQAQGLAAPGLAGVDAAARRRHGVADGVDAADRRHQRSPATPPARSASGRAARSRSRASASVGYHGGQLDGSITIDNAAVPGLQRLRASPSGVQDACSAATTSASRATSNVNLMNGLVHGPLGRTWPWTRAARSPARSTSTSASHARAARHRRSTCCRAGTSPPSTPGGADHARPRRRARADEPAQRADRRRRDRHPQHRAPRSVTSTSPAPTSRRRCWRRWERSRRST